MSTSTSAAALAIDGGTPALPDGITTRRLFDQQEKDAVVELFDRAIAEGSHVIGYGGEQEQAYCQQFCDLLGGGYADGVSSGTNAVHVALAALEPAAGSEIVVPAVTDAGGMMPVAMLGCTPVIADAAPGYYNVGAEQIEAVLSERTAAIMVTHVGGIPCEMDPILALAERRGIPVLEDCAQAHLARYHGRPLGTLGDTAAFSTMFGKQHASAGQGGLVYTRDETRYWTARRYADRGKPLGLTGEKDNVVASLNFNMDELHAAVGRVSLTKLPAFIARRQEIAGALAEHCRSELETVCLIEPAEGSEGSYWFLALSLALEKLSVDRDRIAEALKAEGLPAMPGYVFPGDWHWLREHCPACRRPRPCGRDGCAGNAAYELPALPNARAADRHLIRVPIHEGWTDADVAGAIQALTKVDRAYRK